MVTLTINQALLEAIEAHKSGRLQDAEKLYRAILKVNPHHPDANHNLGVLAVGVGKSQEALPYFEAALNVNSQLEQFWISYINALIDVNEINKACKIFIDAQKQGLSEVVKQLEDRINQETQCVLKKPLLNSNKKHKSSKYINKAEKTVFTSNQRHLQEKLDRLFYFYSKDNFDAANKIASELIRQYPNNPYGWKVLGAIYSKIGKLADAVEVIKKGIQLDPNDAYLHSNLGNILRELGRLDESERSCREALLLNKDFAEAYNNLGNVLRDLKRLDESKACYLEALRLKPDYVEAHDNLGAVLQDLGRFTEAEASHRAALRLNPDYFSAHNNLAIALTRLERSNEAEISCRDALCLNPNYGYAHFNLGYALQKLGRLNEAEVSYHEALRLTLKIPELHNNLGNIYKDLGRLTQAESNFREALYLNPNFTEAYFNLGNTLKLMGRLINAEECYREALRLMPNHYKAYIGLGCVLQELGLTNEAEESFREAIRLDSNHETYSNLLFHLNYSIYHNGEEIYKEYKQYSDFIRGLKLKKFIHNKNKLIQKARIRIGYCSADFKGHACRFFIEPLFSLHDKDKFELYAYANVIQPDLHTERFKTYFDYWVDVLNLNDLQMAQRIYDDNIDILIDLSGHTKGNRLPVFALKPAPIQVTYFSGTGYTSGLKEIDYFFGDNTITPFGSEQYFSERIWLLPSPITCYDYTLNNAPEVSDLPALYNGYITFGSMSRNIRLNDEVLAAWKEIMIHIPDCRLQLNQKIYSDSLTKEFILKRMKCLGMPIDRIDLLDTVPHWNGFHGIDIVLDPFPHNGGTATIEAIFMGVPVLTKLDRPSVGRLGASILSSIELHDWIVEDTSTYINKAIQFSRDLVLLKELRKTLRSRILDSELTDTKSLIKKIENAYQEMIDRVK